MLTSIRSFAAATLMTSTVLAATPAFAQDEAAAPGAITVSGSVTLVSDYRFRGVSLSGGDPAIQGGIDLAHESGFYVGTWASSIDDGGTDLLGDVELDVYAGWSGEVSDGLTLDASTLLPAKKGYYSFAGSLTTPPCSEGVQWMVLKEPVKLGAQQIKAFRQLYNANARPVQPLNGRIVKEST